LLTLKEHNQEHRITVESLKYCPLNDTLTVD